MASLGVLGAGLLVGVFALNAGYTYGTGEDATFTVTDKERIVEKSSDSVSSKYIVFTDKKADEKEVFENTDSFFRLKFNSSDVQGQLKKGETYNCKVYGWRVPFFSMYRNIVSCAPAAK